jgi:outer membrane receptor protein involved in Fe transport
MTKKLFRATLLGATMLMGMGTAPAFAQDAAGDAAQDTEQESGSNVIVVTATRRATSLQDVPINISAIGAEQLADQRLNDIRDLGAFTPGITITDTGPRGAGTIVMRGLSADDSSTFADNSNNAIGIYLGECDWP